MEHGIGPKVSSSVSGELHRVGLVYDERMCKHSTPDGDPHPENPNHIRAIWNKLLTAKIPQRLNQKSKPSSDQKVVCEPNELSRSDAGGHGVVKAVAAAVTPSGNRHKCLQWLDN
ncbi:hypothetical protein L1887_36253 [Cichorium endivia]|nr:hypothetical protein L1887_36253 [Cichorium endivia]